MQLICSQREFNDICAQLKQEPVIYIDTEFYRRDTYYAKLCLLQIATKKQCYIVDPLSGVDIAVFGEILSSNAIIKVLHSADQDLQIFYNIFGFLPNNIFDTQIAANVCNMGNGCSYQKLCQKLLNIDLDKSLQVSDWQVRPISAEHLKYASLDVQYLVPLYEKLSNIINNQGLELEFKRQMNNMVLQQSKSSSPERIMQRMKIYDINNLQRNNLLELISFREECAQKINIPRNHFLTDNDLIHLAIKLPKSQQDCDKMGIYMKRVYREKFMKKLVDLCIGLQENE